MTNGNPMKTTAEVGTTRGVGHLPPQSYPADSQFHPDYEANMARRAALKEASPSATKVPPAPPESKGKEAAPATGWADENLLD